MFVVAAALAAVLSGCGVTRAVSSVIDPAAQAADVTAHAPGYKVAMTMRIATGGTQAGTATGTGTFTRSPKAGSFSFHEQVAGRTVATTIKFLNGALYFDAGALAGGHGLPGGKHWVKYDISQLLGGSSPGGLAGDTSDPGQYMRYLHAAGTRAKPLGHAVVRGVPTTGYHVLVDLNRYASQASAADRPALRRILALTKAATGRTTMPFDVWIDSAKRLRRMSFSITECISGHRLSLGMVTDLYDFGAQPTVTAPAASDTYDITSKLRGLMSHVSFTCGTAT